MISKKRPVTGAIILIIVSSTFLMYAFSTGITGRTLKNVGDNGCLCHSTVPSGNVTVVIGGPSVMNTSETANFTITISGGPLTAAGVHWCIEWGPWFTKNRFGINPRVAQNTNQWISCF